MDRTTIPGTGEPLPIRTLTEGDGLYQALLNAGQARGGGALRLQ